MLGKWGGGGGGGLLKIIFCKHPDCPSNCPPVVEEVCTGGMEFTECGSACPPTCDDKVIFFCTLQCVAGKEIFITTWTHTMIL